MAGKKKRDGEVALKVFYHQRRMEECLNHHKALQNINSFLYSDGHVKLDFVIRGSLILLCQIHSNAAAALRAWDSLACSRIL
jgi:hypothetical protein